MEFGMKKLILATVFSLTVVSVSHAQSSTLAGISFKHSTNPKQSAKVLPPDKDKQGKPIIAGYQKHSITFAGGSGANVTSMLYTPGNQPDGKRHAAVILVHGLGGNKDQLAMLAVMLAQKGYAALCIDAAGHGDRPKIGGAQENALGVAPFKAMIAQTVQDLRCAVDVLAARKDVDTSRIGYVGASLGGIIGSRFLADEPRIACATILAAGGNLGQLLATSQIEGAKKLRAGKKIDPVAIQKELNEVDPAKHIGRAKPRPMLYLHGDKDDVVPVANNEALFKATKQPKERVLMPGGHVPNPFELISKTVAFFDKNLNGAAAK
jgi:dienelactone hydrolase